MIRLIDETALHNDAWIHAVDIGHNFLTFWTKTRRAEIDQRFPHHDNDRYHAGRSPQEWVEDRWPGQRWAAHFHVDTQAPTISNLTEFQGEISPAFWSQIVDHFGRGVKWQ